MVRQTNALEIKKYVEKNAYKVGHTGKLKVKTTLNREGYSNDTFYVNINEEKYFLKAVNDPVVNELKIAKREAYLMKFFNDICPKIYLLDSSFKQPVIWMEFLEGKALENLNIKNKDLLMTAEIMAKIHNTNLKKINPILKKTSSKIIGSPLPQCKKLVEKYGKEDIFKYTIKVIDMAHAYLKSKHLKFEKTLVHGDYKFLNLIKTKKGLKLIDWETSHIDDPAKDVLYLLWLADYYKTLNEKQKEKVFEYYARFREDEDIKHRYETYYLLGGLYTAIWGARFQKILKTKGLPLKTKKLEKDLNILEKKYEKLLSTS